MEFKQVESSNIDKIGYEDNNLYVKYKTGNTYKFRNVPLKEYYNFMEADSKGRFFNSSIKGKYEFEKITEEA